MASFQSFGGFGSHGADATSNRITKAKPKNVVKPILKKLQTQSEKNSIDLDRGWNDQDEVFWGQPGNRNPNGGNGAWATAPTNASLSDASSLHSKPTRPAKDVSFTFSDAVSPTNTSTAPNPFVASHAHAYSHARSVSGNSHASIATSTSGSLNGAGLRSGGSFVHPFQQIPRSATSPVLYTNPFASYGASADSDDGREYSVRAIAEADDAMVEQSDSDSVSNAQPLAGAADSTSGLGAVNTRDAAGHPRRSSLQQQRPPQSQDARPRNSCSQSQLFVGTSSGRASSTNSPPRALTLDDTNASATISATTSSASVSTLAANTSATGQSKPKSTKKQPPLRIRTSRSSSVTPAQSSKLSHVSSRSHISGGGDASEDESAADTATQLPRASLSISKSPTEPAATNIPRTPLRTSFEGAFPRLRAKSDLDTATRQDHVREARRKFQERERAKDEKYEREEQKRRARANEKRMKQEAAAAKEARAQQEAQEFAELCEALPPSMLKKHKRKASAATSSGRPSFASTARPSTSRANTWTNTPTDAQHPWQDSTGQSLHPQTSEIFTSHNYSSVDAHSPPATGPEAGRARQVNFTSSKRTQAAKRKTNGAWHSFLFWLRTKLLRAKGH